MSLEIVSFNYRYYFIIDASTETLTTGRMISSPPPLVPSNVISEICCYHWNSLKKKKKMKKYLIIIIVLVVYTTLTSVMLCAIWKNIILLRILLKLVLDWTNAASCPVNGFSMQYGLVQYSLILWILVCNNLLQSKYKVTHL